jgi:hypothetical protein
MMLQMKNKTQNLAGGGQFIVTLVIACASRKLTCRRSLAMVPSLSKHFEEGSLTSCLQIEIRP